MKIAIEAFWVNTKQLTGVGYYILNLYREIDKLHPGNEYYFLYTGDKWIGPDLGDNFTPVCYGKGKATAAIFFNLHKVIKNLKPDLYHATYPTRVPPQKLPCSVVTTVHDLLNEHIGSLKNKIIFNLTTRAAWRKSEHFLCNSSYTAGELIEYKGIPEDIITVTHLAPAYKIPNWKSPGKHILFVGSLNSRKNPLFLLDVYYQLCNIMERPLPLIFAGDYRPETASFGRMIKKCPANGRVEWLRYVDKKRLAELYSNAALLILPSSLEGFGMPIIEAMSAGVPVVCSEIKVFREITDGDAKIIPGWDINKWADEIKSLLENTSELEKLSSTGKARASSYTWNNCAEKTWQVYRRFNSQQSSS